MHPPQLAHPKLRGEWAEVYFMKEAMARGLVVAKPYGESHKYDFIVESGGKFSRVQVRAAFRCSANHFTVAATTASRRGRYSRDAIDFIAACAVPECAWYIIPVEEFLNATAIHLAPHRRSRGRFEKFREAWEFLSRVSLY